MSDVNVIEFPTRMVTGTVDQVVCAECGSRAMRLTSPEYKTHGFDIECHNCGETLIGLKVQWDQLGTT